MNTWKVARRNTIYELNNVYNTYFCYVVVVFVSYLDDIVVVTTTRSDHIDGGKAN